MITTRPWDRLSFIAQLGVITGLALVVAGVVMLVSSIRTDTLWHQNRLEAQAKYELQSLVPALSEQVVIGDFSTMEQILKGTVRRDNITSLRYVSRQGASLQVVSIPAEPHAPAWFVRASGLHPVDDGTDLTVGGTIYGTLSIRMTPNPAIDRSWEGLRNHFLILALAAGLNFLGILLIIKNGLKSLGALNQGAERFGTGDLATRIPLRGSPEVRVAISTFNGMADNIQSLLAQVHREKELAEVTLRSIGDAVITTDEREQVAYLNPVAENLTGWTTQQALGRPLREVFNIVDEFTREPAPSPVGRVLQERGIVGMTNHTVLIARSGREYAIEDSAAPIRGRDADILGVVLVFHDVSEQRKLTHQLFYQARHDALTGLINRGEFERRLDELIERAASLQMQHALLYLDLDQFKVVNDTCGHSAGDELLRQLTALILSTVPESTTFARLGGDEFGVLLENCSLDQALRAATDLLNEAHTFRFVWLGKTFAVGVSIGLVTITETCGNSASVLAAADTACYAAKDKGRNRVQVYSPDDKDMAERRGEMRWVARITQAFEEERFRLYHQPIASLRRGTQEPEQHFEVLLRMLDEDNNLVLPGAFIPAAERYNMMVDIDRWVVRSTLSRLMANPGRAVTCAINLSGQSVNDDRFLGFLIEQIKGADVPPHKLCFEITETAAISNLAKAGSFIRAIKSLGCRFSLDDFGSGMSSFAYLKNLPVDFLKIDGGFVQNMLNDPIDCAMVESINHIGHVLGIETIAEFVENQAILEKLRTIGVDYVQGYGVARPGLLEHRMSEWPQSASGQDVQGT